jgi:ATP-dependent helicase/nuclease subunit B
VRVEPAPDALLVVEGEAEVRYAWERGKLAVTRDGLYARLLAALAPDVSLASPLVARLVLSDVLLELAATEAWLGALAGRGGRAWIDLGSAFLVSLTEARGCLWCGPLTRELDPDLLEDPRARGLFAAGRALDKALGRMGLVDPGAMAEVVARALAHAPMDRIVSSLDARTVIATGIASWLPADLGLWRLLDARLSLVGGSAKIELATFDRPLDASRALDPLGRLIDAIAEALDDAPETRPITAVLGDFTFGTLSDASRTRVEVRRADSSCAQARAILDAALDVLSKGASAEEIAVAIPQRSGSMASIARTLEEGGIAVHASIGEARMEGGLMACAREAMTVAEHGVPRLGLAALLRSPYLSVTAGLGSETESRAALDRLSFILEATPSMAGERPQDAIASTVLAFEGAEPEELAPMAVLARRVAEGLTRATQGATRREHLTNVRRLFQTLGLEARPGRGVRAHFAQDLPAQGVTRAELDAFARDARGAARLGATLDAYERAAAQLTRDSPSSFASFRLELQRELAAEETGGGPSVGAIRISALRDLPARPLALLVFADANEGSLDPLPEGVGLFDASMQARLTEKVEPPLRASLVAARDADRVRLAIAADRARRVVVAYATRDEEGGLLPPHPFVAWLEREGVPQSVWRDRVRVERALTAREERLRRLSTRRAEASALAPLAAQRAAAETRRESAFGLPAPSGEAIAPPRAMSEGVQAVLREETGGGETAMSVTSLDRFGACLFRGFAAQVLRARKTRIVPDIVDARQEGTLLHGALAAAFGATRDLWACRPRDADRIRETAKGAASAFLASHRTAAALRRADLDEIGVRVSKVVDWSLADEEWDFFQAESRFGVEAKRRASPEAGTVVLEDDRQALRVSGSIDRVDVARGRTRLRVIDYKRSEDSARRLTSELGEASFQLAIYAGAASLTLDIPAAPGMYLPTRYLSVSYRTRGSEAAWEKAHELEGGLPRYARRALDLMRRVRQGDVEARPARPETCEFCDFDGVCRKPRFVITASIEEGQDEVRDSG